MAESSDSNPQSVVNWTKIQMQPFSSVKESVKEEMGILLGRGLCTAEDWVMLAELLRFNKVQIERIRQEGMKEGKIVGLVLLEELDKRGGSCTVKTVEDCLIMMDRQDVIDVLYKTAAKSTCALTCSLMDSPVVHLTQYVSEDMTLEYALKNCLLQRDLKPSDLGIESIPTVDVKWDTSVGMLKGYHVRLHRKLNDDKDDTQFGVEKTLLKGKPVCQQTSLRFGQADLNISFKTMTLSDNAESTPRNSDSSDGSKFLSNPQQDGEEKHRPDAQFSEEQTNESIYMTIFNSQRERQEFVSSLEQGDGSNDDVSKGESELSKDVAIGLPESSESANDDQESKELSATPGWHPHVPDNKCEIIKVMAKYRETSGSYIIRRTKEHYLAVSVICPDRHIKHYKLHHVQREQSQWYFYRSGPRMPSLAALLDHYKDSPLSTKPHSDEQPETVFLTNPILTDNECL